AIRRLALALDIPPEVMTGMGQSNHWSAWQVEESAIKIHIEPLLTLICDRLTTALLRPVLEARGVQNPEDYCIWFETTRLSQSPDRGPEALALWDRGLLTNEMVLREHGYDPDTDLPPDAGEPPSGAPSEPSAPVREESEPERQRGASTWTPRSCWGGNARWRTRCRWRSVSTGRA